MNESTLHADIIKPWEKISSTIALDEKWFTVRKDTVRLPSGKVIDDYFVWESPDIAVVVPYTKDGKFVICRQYRYGVDKVLYQFPAGAIGKGEDPQDAALREMQEETGYEAGDTVFLTKTPAYATKLTGWQHIYLATGVYDAGTKQEDHEEPTEVLLKTPDELRQLIKSGEFCIPDSLAAALLAFEELGV